MAAATGQTSILKALLSKANDRVDILDDQGRTLLWWAKDEFSIRLLIENHAIVIAKNLSGQNALFNTENDEGAVRAVIRFWGRILLKKIITDLQPIMPISIARQFLVCL